MPPRVSLVQRIQQGAAAVTGRRAFWIAFVGAIASWPLVWSALHVAPPLPPALGQIPSLVLVDEQGRTFGTADLEGRVWVAGTVATQPPGGAGDEVTLRMARIQDRGRQLAPAFHLVSIAADPERDTPERLRAHARAHRASPRMWSFVTGRTGELRRALLDAASGAGRAEGAGASRTCREEDTLFLVDGELRVRACYDARREDAVDDVLRDASLLVNAARQRSGGGPRAGAGSAR